MPPDDGVSVVVLEPEGEEDMTTATDLPANVATQMLTQLMQTGNVAQNNFVTTNKAQDLDYLIQKNLVSLPAALGAREVASNDAMAGRPNGA